MFTRRTYTRRCGSPLSTCGHAAALAVDLRLHRDPGEGIAEARVVIGEGLGRRRDLLAVVGLAHADVEQRLELLLARQVVALEPHTGDHEALALRDVHRHAEVLAVGRDGHLRGVDAEFHVAAREVVGAQRLQVGIELGARVLVRLGVPAHPAAAVLVEQAQQRVLREGLLAHDADLADACGLALGHVEAQVHAVAVDRRDGGHHRGVVEAAAHVLALDLLLGAVGQRLVASAPFGQAHLGQGLDERLLVELLGADEVDVGHGGAFLHDDDQGAVAHVDAHVLEDLELEQRTDGSRAALVGVGVADMQRNGGEDGAGLDALEALHTDVAHGEGIDGPGGRCCERAGQRRGRAQQAKV